MYGNIFYLSKMDFLYKKTYNYHLKRENVFEKLGYQAYHVKNFAYH